MTDIETLYSNYGELLRPMKKCLHTFISGLNELKTTSQEIEVQPLVSIFEVMLKDASELKKRVDIDLFHVENRPI